ncbi:S41 family peptidase [Winogradskyella tangerina]|uniref:S41 family peptidase n=1 Tax=Winogradskyella tangerina TaxID=2023240 RepID=UPI001E343260|nr:S41 family peptidase [Winogradskyella tangerina]
MKFRIRLIIFVLLFGCSGNEIRNASSSTSDTTLIEISIVAQNYLDELIGIMEDNALHRNSIAWEDFRLAVYAEANGAQTISETYPGILKALELLGDNHSFYRAATGTYLNPNSMSCDGTGFSTPDLPSTIGYVKVNNYYGATQTDEGQAFALEIQDQIRAYDSPEITGWIVDLRGNLGGNMWPMLAGVGPVLGEGIAGNFSYPDNTFVPWSFNNGAAMLNNNSVLQVENSYQLQMPNPKVAVLLDNAVASSGEAIAVSFLGRPNAKTFGSATCGLSTANEGFNLSDSATLFLTTSNMADRNLEIYGQAIQPDQESSTASIIQDALQWLEN